MPSRIQGAGVSLRAVHYQEIEASERDLGWLEIMADDHLPGPTPGPSAEWVRLEAIAERYPVVLHGVGLDLGGTDPLDTARVRATRDLAEALGAAWISDHLAWTGAGGVRLHELMPLPHTLDVARYVADRIRRVQDLLELPFLVENVSTYLRFPNDEMPEHAFLLEVLERSGAGLLLDVNNLHVNAVNHRFDPEVFLDALPPAAVAQVHLAGYENRGTHLLDTHGHPVQPPVWALYRSALARLGAVPTNVEWDVDIPPLGRLLDERETVAAELRERERCDG